MQHPDPLFLWQHPQQMDHNFPRQQVEQVAYPLNCHHDSTSITTTIITYIRVVFIIIRLIIITIPRVTFFILLLIIFFTFSSALAMVSPTIGVITVTSHVPLKILLTTTISSPDASTPAPTPTPLPPAPRPVSIDWSLFFSSYESS